jgi:CcmD family protein
VIRLALVGGLCALLLVAMTHGVSAQTQQPPTDGFLGAKPGDLGQEQLPATRLVFAAYAFVWVALLVYVFWLWQRLQKVERELAEVSSRLRIKRP